mmetsp:Transcript_18642/g.33698  ORF Transcript_18642/g.33698 Transcript_18642/m.33698 type:complete len:873 (+) Transcript_18642:16-2634(+)
MTGYFANSTRGEIPELQKQLNATKPEKKRDAVKKVIAAMTVGKDVSSLFAPVIKCMVTSDIELKKLVYLYIINYAKSQPELAFMAVNSFRKDARQRTNPLLRALAVRTMGYIRVERISEYICEPLSDALRDDDPYVRKTAAICVAKLYEIAPELIEDHEILVRLRELLHDGNAMVVANALAAVAEISEIRGTSLVTMTNHLIGKVLAALNECTDWGQIFILDYLSGYIPADSREAESIVERVVPRLAHNNPALVLTAAKVVVRYMDFVTSADVIRSMSRKLAPSLVTLLASQPEIQYVALRNISLIVQKRPNILEKDVRIFFCKYNDPNYVKMEKLDIIYRLADIRNVDLVLNELKEYATEVDVEFVRKSVRTIGRIALKLDKAADRCVSALQDLIQLKLGMILQEVVVVVKDVFRRYPNRFEMLIKDIFNNFEELDDGEARAAFVWILGEYAERIDDADSQIGRFVESFKDEQTIVQFQILTATVKLFLKKPEESEELIANLFRIATEECTNPDLRDRALVYWRMLSSDPQATRQVVMCQRPSMTEDSTALEAGVLEKLLEQLSTVASVYHKPAENILASVRAKAFEPDTVQEETDQVDTIPDQPSEAAGVTDLLDLEFDGPQSLRAKVPMQIVMTQETPSSTTQAKGLHVEMAFQRIDSRLVLETKFVNCTTHILNDWAMQFNVNPFGIQMAEPLVMADLLPENTAFVSIRLNASVNPTDTDPGIPFVVQMAVKCSIGVYYFQTPCMLSVLLTEEGKIDRDRFRMTWTSISDANEFSHTITTVNPKYKTLDSLKGRLEANNIFLIAQRNVQETSEEVMYCSSKSVTEVPLLTELRLPMSMDKLTVSVRTNAKALVPLFIQAVNFLLSTTH